MKKALIILIPLSFLILASPAKAAFIVKGPSYLGLTNGLVGYWSFNGPDMSGNTATDRSGQGNNGTLTNGPVRAIGKIGQTLDFDGSDDLVDMGDVLDFNSAKISISAWIFPRSLGEGSSGRIVDKDVGADGYRFNVDPTTNRLQIEINGKNHNSDNNAVTLNEWQHVAFTYDATTARFFTGLLPNEW